MEAVDSISNQKNEECVICQESILERAIAVPCNHLCFDFICLATWIQEQPKCPLCKASVEAIEYDWRSPTEFKTFLVPAKSLSEPALSITAQETPQERPRRRRQSVAYSSEIDTALLRRRKVYRHGTYSRHIGSNRVSGFRSFTPATFDASLKLRAKARKWIRRELQVFDHMRQAGTSPSRLWAGSRVRNAEFLLEYIVDVLRIHEIKGGKVEALLRDYLGDDTGLFLHELNSWLRSPFEELLDWDNVVQYGNIPPRMYATAQEGSEAEDKFS